MQNSTKQTAGEERSTFQVLVADDNRTNQKVIEGVLRGAGHEALVVDAGDAALDILVRRMDVDAVIMDIAMPQTDGIETTKLIRFSEAGIHQAARIPVIALTADGSAEREASCREAGMDAFLTHPVPPAELVAVLSTLVMKRRDALQTAPSHAGRLVIDIIEHPDFRTSQERSVRGDVLQSLYDLGGTHFLNSLSESFQTDASVAISFMANAIRTDDVALFKQQVMHLNSAATALGSITASATYQTTKGLSEAYLASVGPLILARMRHEVSTVVDALTQFEPKAPRPA